MQSGQVVINYDFHWNPIRLIQRAGRIDRINSSNEVIVVHNFLLDLEIEKDIRLESSVEQKIDQIQRIIGEDYKILKENERINTKDNYAIYSCDDKILDREAENPIEPTEIENMLEKIKRTQPKLWKLIGEMPDGIRASIATNNSRGRLLLACESSNADGEILRKYYVVSSNAVREISATRALNHLKSDDTEQHALPGRYDRLVASGWSRFVSDVEQIEARTSHPRLKPNHKWVLQVLLKLAGKKKFASRRALIETLRNGFSVPFKKNKLDRELRKMKQSKLDDEQILLNLAELYRRYGLQNHHAHAGSSFPSRRILYSKWIGDKNGK